MINLASFSPNTPFTPHTERGGISIHLTEAPVSVSPAWTIGDFSIRFVRLAASETLQLDRSGGTTRLKIVTGEVDCAPHRPFPAVGEVVSTTLTASSIQAIRDSVFCLVTEPDGAAGRISDMAQLQPSGPLQEVLRWQSFDEKFSAVTDIFRGLEAHMLPGFHLLDASAREIAYVGIRPGH